MEARCPKNPNHKRFVTQVVVTQDWIVDKNGNKLGTIEFGQEIQGPEYWETWSCNTCMCTAQVTRGTFDVVKS